jgi:hypothetical protein
MSSWILRGARLSQLQYFLGLNILSFFLSNHPLSLFLLAYFRREQRQQQTRQQ